MNHLYPKGGVAYCGAAYTDHVFGTPECAECNKAFNAEFEAQNAPRGPQSPWAHIEPRSVRRALEEEALRRSIEIDNLYS